VFPPTNGCEGGSKGGTIFGAHCWLGSTKQSDKLKTLTKAHPIETIQLCLGCGILEEQSRHFVRTTSRYKFTYVFSDFLKFRRREGIRSLY